MKKFTALLLAAFILLTAVGCAKKEPSAAPATIEGTTAEIIDKIYANHKEVDLYLETLPLDAGRPAPARLYPPVGQAGRRNHPVFQWDRHHRPALSVHGPAPVPCFDPLGPGQITCKIGEYPTKAPLRAAEGGFFCCARL